MWSIVRKELKLLLKGKGNFFFLIIMPILFIVLFGSVFSGASNSTLTVNYVDLDQSTVSRSFLQAVGHVNGFALKPAASSSVDDEIRRSKTGKWTRWLSFRKALARPLRPANIKPTFNFTATSRRTRYPDPLNRS